MARADPTPRVVEVKTNEAILRVGNTDDFDRLTPQLAGARLSVVREDGDWYGVALGPNRTGWIAKADVTALPPETPAPAAHLVNVWCHPKKDAVDIDFELSQPVAVEVRETEQPPTLQVSLATTTLVMFEIRQPHGTELVRSIVVDQPADGVATATIALSSPRLWGYHLTRSAKGVTLEVRKPPTQDNTVVILDPGHGGSDTGAVGLHGLREKAVNLAVALAVRERLQKAGIKVVMTHDTDAAVAAQKPDELAARVAAGRAARGTVFVSIHHNARPKVEDGRVAHGTWIYFYRPQSRTLAAALAAPVAHAIHEPDYGPIWRSFHVIRQSDMPAVLIEVQFISNPKWEQDMRTPEYVAHVSAAIANSIRTWLGETR
jgi:N-acetylmuramoyl-L-alanine amidase